VPPGLFKRQGAGAGVVLQQDSNIPAPQERKDLVLSLRHYAATGPAQAGSGRPDSAGSLARVRLTAFWERMHTQFGDAYASSVAQDYVIAVLGDRTVNQALADGVAVVTVWRGVCEAFELPERVR
jgi:hypothetical protein